MLLELYACLSAMPSGFEQGFGLDLLEMANRRPDSMRAISTSAITVGGPIMLVSNVLGLIGRYPVFVPGKPWRVCRQRSQQQPLGASPSLPDLCTFYRNALVHRCRH